jgi:serine/threonine protein kinase
LPSLLRDVLPPGTLLKDTYRIDYALGRGGFGITYRAMHKDLELPVAIKEFYPQEHALREGKTGQLIVPNTKQDVYQRNLVRFLREGRILARLNHPNVVQVRDYCEERNTAYLVMELIRGKTLQDELNEQPEKKLPVARVRELIERLVDALSAIHHQEIYHLDIKPENILITPENHLVLVDFGASRQGLGTGSTQAYTLNYAAPEVISGTNLGAHSDLFELGMMLHQMLTGKLPPQALNRLIGDSWSPVDLFEPWRGLVAAMLQIKPEERPRSVLSWWETLLEFEERERRLEKERRRQEEEARKGREAEERRKQEEERQRREIEGRQREERRRQEEEARRRRERIVEAEQQRLLQDIEERNREKSATDSKGSRRGKKEIPKYYLLFVLVCSGFLSLLDQPVAMYIFILAIFTFISLVLLWIMIEREVKPEWIELMFGTEFFSVSFIVCSFRFIVETFFPNVKRFVPNVLTRDWTLTESLICTVCLVAFSNLVIALPTTIIELQKSFSKFQAILISLGTSGLGLGLGLLVRLVASR